MGEKRTYLRESGVSAGRDTTTDGEPMARVRAERPAYRVCATKGTRVTVARRLVLTCVMSESFDSIVAISVSHAPHRRHHGGVNVHPLGRLQGPTSLINTPPSVSCPLSSLPVADPADQNTTWENLPLQRILSRPCVHSNVVLVRCLGRVYALRVPRRCPVREPSSFLCWAASGVRPGPSIHQCATASVRKQSQ